MLSFISNIIPYCALEAYVTVGVLHQRHIQRGGSSRFGVAVQCVTDQDNLET